jgi:transcriptional regulator
MFRPAPFRVDDPARLAAFIAEYPFGILVTASEDGEPMATHIPFLFRPEGSNGAGPAGLLLGHMARANPHWRALDGHRPARVIFAGPHGYISPAWYGEHPSVPTWNYATVHAIGRPRAFHNSEALWHLLETQVAAFESGRSEPWQLVLPEEYRRRMLAGIVGIEMPVERIEGKFKLSQNRSTEDRRRVIAALEASGRAGGRELGAFMDAHRDILFPEDAAEEAPARVSAGGDDLAHPASPPSRVPRDTPSPPGGEGRGRASGPG